MEINFTSTGMFAMENMLNTPARQSEHLEPVFQVIASRMMTHERELFESAGASVGRPWKALDENTIKQKTTARNPFPTRPLSATLNLMRSLSVRGHPDMILQITDSFIRFGTKVDYAQFHDAPGDEQRKPIMFSMKEISSYWNTVQGYIFRGELPNA